MGLNESKTKTMLVADKLLHKKTNSTSLTVHLNFNESIDNLCKKLTQRIAFLKKIRHHLPLDQQILYYNSMIKQIIMAP
ncbi:hypothetical protein pdam_00025680, partial [Pocillopora damicornis]